MEEIVNVCKSLLNQHPSADYIREYLSLRLNNSSIQDFDFGYFPNNKDLSLITSNLGLEVLKENKLLYQKIVEDAQGICYYNFLYFDNYPLIIPFKDQYGKIIALVGRNLLPEEERRNLKISKYKNTVFTKGNYLFGLFEAKQSIIEKNVVYIVEGQFDVIKLREIGLTNVVALGNSNMTLYQFSLICRYANKIIILLDNDEAGYKGRKMIESKFGHLANIENLYVPDPFKDIDEYIKADNINSLNNLNLIIK